MKVSERIISQKGFSTITVIGVLVIIGVLAAGLLVISGSKKPMLDRGPSFSPKISGVTEFEKIEDSSYVFYYPKRYTKSPSQNKEVLRYINPNTKAVEAESITLTIEPQSERLWRPNFDKCSSIARGFLTKEGDKVVKAEAIFEENSYGCRIITTIDVTGVNDEVVINSKYLWKTTGDDYSLYHAKALYYANASRGEADRLDLAVNKFKLK